MMKRLLLFNGLIAWLASAAHGQENSVLWGRNGEAWNPAGRLPDVSFAGYACGGRPLPKVAVAANVRDFGAKGDGTTDDSAAFLAAIAKVERGAIEIPPGRYRITRILEITKPGIVLRGAGPEHSVLVCPTPLQEIKPHMVANSSGRPTSQYSWGGGIVCFKGKDSGESIGPISAPAKRGDRELQISGETAGLSPGTRIEITVHDDADKSLLNYLYSGDPGNISNIKAGKHLTRFVTRVAKVADNRVTLERPLRFDIRPEWKPEVRFYQPSVTESGIEDLAFEFPARKYGGHFTEIGFNAVDFSGVADCWARNVLITNADSGVFANGNFCTIDGLRFQLNHGVEIKGVFGHHGVSLTGNDNLFTHFEIHQRFIHDITVSGGAGNVTSAGSGTDLSLDHHKKAPYDNVFTDIDLGDGSRMWMNGGGKDLGWPCGAHGTFWNIRAKQPQIYPVKFGPVSINLIGVQTWEKSKTAPAGACFETIPPDRLSPSNLYRAQWKKRLGAQ